MGSVWYRFWAELRARGRAWAAVAVLAGLCYGAVLAAFAGGHRVDTVVERSIERYLTPDVFAVPAYSENGELLDFDKIAKFPEVSASFRLPLYPNISGYEIIGYPDLEVVHESGRLLSGRLPDPRRSDEALANFIARDERGLDVGERVDLRLIGPGFSGEGDPPAGPVQHVTIVGVVASLGDFASVAGPGIIVTPAFIEEHAGRASTAELFTFVLKRHAQDLPAFRRHVSELTGGKPVLFIEGRNDWVQIQRSFHVQAAALWILAAFLALVTLLVVTQTLTRLARVESIDDRTLSALGMSSQDRFALAAWRGLVIAAIAATVATMVLVGTSGLMPFGHPRLAEPSPGLSAPGAYVGGGFAVTLLLIILQSAVPTLALPARGRARATRVAGLAAQVPGARASVGLRLALEPGRGVDAVPVRSGLAGLTLGVLALVMSLTVSSSLDHLLATPRLYGWGWDVVVDMGAIGDDAAATLEGVPGVAAVGYGNVSALVSIGPISAELVALEPGPVKPVMLEGRPPDGADEVALARKTLRAAHVQVGSYVLMSLQGQQASHRMRVTGVTVLPVESDASTLGEGVLVSGRGLRTFLPEVRSDTAFVVFDGRAAHATVTRALRALASDDQAVQTPTQPSSLVDFGSVRSLPLVLAGLLTALGLATISHVLVSSIRRRRHDLGVLRALGFDASDVRAAVLWQALTLGVVALVVGIPLGVAAGRSVWLVFAREAGFVGEPITRLGPLVFVAVGVVVVSSLVALQTGRVAARTRPAMVLRDE